MPTTGTESCLPHAERDSLALHQTSRPALSCRSSSARQNEVTIGTDEMVNVNGSTPNLASVTRWYIGRRHSKGPTVYFSDIWLEGADAPAATGPLVRW